MKKLKLEKLNRKEIEEMTSKAEARTDVRLVGTKQINVRLSPEILAKATQLAKLQKMPVTTYLASLLREDIDRLWKIFEKVS